MSQNKQVFDSVIRYALENNYSNIMKEAEFKYDVRPYKISKLTPTESNEIFQHIEKKYIKSDFKHLQTEWHENQRRIFIWFLVFYCDMTEKEPVDVSCQEWTEIALCFFGKNAMFLEFHSRNIMKYKFRPSWTSTEDQILVTTIKNYPLGKWNQVAKDIFFYTSRAMFKTPKQCRQRWFNHLDTSKDKSNWTEVQDKIIVNYIMKHGKKWARMVKQLGNKRTEHMIKNRYNSLLRKYRKFRNQSQKQIFKIMLEQICQANVDEISVNYIDEIEDKEFVQKEREFMIQQQAKSSQIKAISPLKTKGFQPYKEQQDENTETIAQSTNLSSFFPQNSLVGLSKKPQSCEQNSSWFHQYCHLINLMFNQNGSQQYL